MQEYPPAKVAEITWVPEDQIVRAARLLATSKPAAMQWGLAVDMVKEALPAGQAIMALFQVTGNVEVRMFMHGREAGVAAVSYTHLSGTLQKNRAKWYRRL